MHDFQYNQGLSEIIFHFFVFDNIATKDTEKGYLSWKYQSLLQTWQERDPFILLKCSEAEFPLPAS